MQIEYEATFTNINKDEIRQKLKKAGARLINPEFLQKRYVFNLPKSHEIKGGWARVRDEGDKITMTVKVVDGADIENQREATLIVNDFEQSRNFLKLVGFREKAFQETKREIWQLDEVEITIDEWPFLEPFVEVEGKSEAAVKAAAEKIGLDYKKALFCSTDFLYSRKYNLPEIIFTDQTPKIVFDMENPFLNR